MIRIMLFLFSLLAVLPKEVQAQEIVVDTSFVYLNTFYTSDTANILSHCVLPLDSTHSLILGAFIDYSDITTLYIRKVNYMGESVWVKYLDDDEKYLKLMSTGSHMIWGHNGEIVITYARYDVTADINATDLRVMSIQPDGTINWIYDLETADNEIPLSVCKAKDGGYAIAAVKQFNSLEDKTLVIKLDNEGLEEWQYQYGPDGQSVQRVWSIEATSDDGFVIGGFANLPFNSDPQSQVLKIDSQGNEQWITKIGKPEHNNSVCSVHQDAEGNYMVNAGIKQVGNYSTVFAKLNAEGDTLWTKTIVMAPWINMLESGLKPLNSGYIAGGRMKFENVHELGYIVRLTADLDTLWTRQIALDQGGSLSLRDLELTPDGGIMLTGIHTGDFTGQSSWFARMDSIGQCCSYITLCDSVVVQIDTIYTNVGFGENLEFSESKVQLASNPVRDRLRLDYQLESGIESAWLKIYDLRGMEVRSKFLNRKRGNIDIEFGQHLASGVYLYSLEGGGRQLSRGKLLKQ